MTLKEAEADSRFESFKFMGMLELVSYIARCDIFLSKNPDDAEVSEFREAAVLIRNERTGS